MASGLLLGMLASGLQQAATNLWTRFQQVKGTDAESRELQEFMTYLEENRSLRISSSKEVRTMVRQRLDEAKTKLKEWSSKNSGFLARSSAERVLELKAQRQFVADTISIANLRIADDMNLTLQQVFELLEEWKRAQNFPKDEKRAHDLPNDGNRAHDLPKDGKRAHDLPKDGNRAHDLPKDRKRTHDLPKDGNRAHDLPKDGKRSQDLPKDRNRAHDLPKDGKRAHDLPKDGKRAHDLPKDGKRTHDLPKDGNRTHDLPKDGKRAHDLPLKQPSTPAHGGRKRPALSPQPAQGISKSIEELSLEAPSSTKPPKSGATGGSALRTRKLTNSDSKKRRVDLWQELWVSIDSEKQANDIKERLRGLEGVKEVHIDQPSQKVSVLLREGSNISKLTKALIENAQLKDKRKPTPWAERPR